MSIYLYLYPKHQHYRRTNSQALLLIAQHPSLINQNKLSEANFEWQESTATFSVSESDINKVCEYILKQKKHHKKITNEQEVEFCDGVLAKAFQKGAILNILKSIGKQYKGNGVMGFLGLIIFLPNPTSQYKTAQKSLPKSHPTSPRP